MSWQAVSVLMIAEIVSNGMLSLPGALAVVGIVPGLILIIFLGVWATFTAWVLIQFKLRHPSVHSRLAISRLQFHKLKDPLQIWVMQALSYSVSAHPTHASDVSIHAKRTP